MICHCGCNQPAKRNFLPGHDQRLRASLEKRTNGILNLEQLVLMAESFANGSVKHAAFIETVKAIFLKEPTS